MVVLFVIATVLVFLIVDYFVQHKQAQLVPAGAAPSVGNRTSHMMKAEDLFLPEGLFSTDAHLWGELIYEGSLHVGIDPFLLNAFGHVDDIQLPEPGARIVKGETLFSLLVDKKKIDVPSPFTGSIEKTNPVIKRKMSADIRDMWSICMRPENLSETIQTFRVGFTAREWMKKELVRFREFLTTLSVDPQVALTMPDGGIPSSGVLKELDDKGWKKFANEFVALEN